MKTHTTFKQFLSEQNPPEQYKRSISGEEVIEILRTKCKDFLAGSPDRPLVRGMSGSDESYIVHGEAGGRKSANTTNHYTAILNHTLGKKGYPLRSKSIICGNMENKEYARGFGDNLFAIIPFDGVKIGVCPTFDLWEVTLAKGLNTGVERLKMETLNFWFDGARVPDSSFDEIVDFIEQMFKQPVKSLNDHAKRLLTYFTEGEVAEQLERAYGEECGFRLVTTKDVNDLPLKRREMWVGGKCLAVPMEEYEHLLSKVQELQKRE